MAEGDTPSAGSLLQRACENCRLRKMRCDKQVPCSSCRTLNISCRASKEDTDYRPRAVPTNYVGKQIQLIQERLSTIEGSMQDRLSAIERHMQRLSEQSHAFTSSDSLQAVHGDPVTQAANSPATAIPSAERDSPFAQQTLQAKETANTTAEILGYRFRDDVSATLTSLKDTLDTHFETSSSDQFLAHQTVDHPSLSVQLPPVSFVVEMVKSIKARPPTLLVGFSMHDMSLVENLFRKVYLPFEPATSGSVALAHGLLYFIMRDMLQSRDPISERHDFAGFMKICEKSFSTALANFEIFAVPALENAQVLFFGAIKALDEGKLSLCWTYLSSASTICHTLGIHRESILRKDHPDVAHQKRLVFWMLHMIEKNLSLTLGRSSNFRDYDIDCGYFSISPDPRLAPWDLANIACVKVGIVQSRIYDQFYSATAKLQSCNQRAQVVEEIVIELHRLQDEIRSIDTSGAYLAEWLHVAMSYEGFFFNSLLTTCYLSQTSTSEYTEISIRCHSAAKLSLSEFSGISDKVQHYDFCQSCDFINWVLLFTSFTPFVVVFAHAVATNDQEDLDLLQNTVNALERVKDINRWSHRLYSVCKAFLDVSVSLSNAHQVSLGLTWQEDGSLLFPSPNMAAEFTRPHAISNTNMTDDDLSEFIESLVGTGMTSADSSQS